MEPQQVPKGKACGCVCPGCGRTLFARSGTRTPHFAHAPGEDCAKALETAIHLAAKQLISDRQELRLPRLTYTNPYIKVGYDEPPPRSETLAAVKTIKLDTVAVETWLGDMRPDIVVTSGGDTYLVEIAVTHFVDDAKKAKIKERQIPSLEIDVSHLHGQATFAGLVDVLFTHRPYPATWIYHPMREERRQQDWAAEQERQARKARRSEEWAKAEAARKATEAAAKATADAKREAQFQKYRALPTPAKLARHLRQLGLTEAQLAKFTIFVPWDNSFGVPRMVWQSAVLVYIAKTEAEQGWGNYFPCQIPVSGCIAWLREAFTVVPPVPDGDEIAVWKYFRYLERLGILRYLAAKKFDLLIRSGQWAQFKSLTIAKPTT